MGKPWETERLPPVSVGMEGLLFREPSVGLVVPGRPDLGADYERLGYCFYLVQLIQSNKNSTPKNSFIHTVSVRK